MRMDGVQYALASDWQLAVIVRSPVCVCPVFPGDMRKVFAREASYGKHTVAHKIASWCGPHTQEGCARCAGTGVNNAFTTFVMENGLQGDDIDMSCEWCGGTGSRPAVTYGLWRDATWDINRLAKVLRHVPNIEPVTLEAVPTDYERSVMRIRGENWAVALQSSVGTPKRLEDWL